MLEAIINRVGDFVEPRFGSPRRQFLRYMGAVAVVLAFPTKGRTKLGLQAFAEGKHVLFEKPVAMNAEEVRQLIDVRCNLVAGCCSSRYRFDEGAETYRKFSKTSIPANTLTEVTFTGRARLIKVSFTPSAATTVSLWNYMEET